MARSIEITTVDILWYFLLIFFLHFFFFFFGCVGSSFLCVGFLQLWQVGGHSSSRCAGLSPSRPLLLRSTGSRRAGSAIVAHGPSRSAARGIFPDQGLNPCPLHWQADSQPLRHQGSPFLHFYIRNICVCPLLKCSQCLYTVLYAFFTTHIMRIFPVSFNIS